MKINKLVILLAVIPVLLGCLLKPTIKLKEDPFSKPYKVEIVDEHRVNLIFEKDTVVLYLENAYAFKEEVVFIEKL